ncbi:hypothetical protein ACFS2C_15730 [Prauserella oleivorans]|uniref:Secreted protein n=1 Tax=Prauserella oleivorans TaxID=1478153 RepID=A0ABW5WCN1_9PSEU
MRKTIVRGVAVATLAAVAMAAAALPASAAAAPAEDEVVIVDEPDTSDLHNVYTVAPLGVPVFGLIRSVAGVPGKILPSVGQ